MRNLKRALCFALAAVMVLGLMITGAGAASTYDNFTDKDEIVHQEAVNTMVSLGVISGKEDGSYYDPTAIVTRAEMTKVVAVALNGGKDPVFSDNDKTTFTDTQGHWAEKYIAYCVRQGIVAGRGDNSFGPDDPLTGSACAKMFLCALGYRADLEGFVNVGNAWELNVNVKANQDAKLYNGLSDITASDPMTRDSMAQMLYNAVQADEVIYDNLFGDYSGVIQARANGTMLWNRFQVRKVTGILEANDKVSVADGTTRAVSNIAGVTYRGNQSGAVALEGRSLIDVTGVSGYDVDSTGGSNSIAGNLFGGHQYKVATTDEMVGQEVVIYVQFQDYLSPNSNNAVVIGEAILTDNNTVVETTKRLKDEAAVRSELRANGLTGVGDNTVVATYSEQEVSINNPTAPAATAAEKAVSGKNAGITDNLTTGRPNNIAKRSAGIFQRFIDNDGDGVANYVIQLIPVLTNVNSVGTDKYTFSGITGTIPHADVITEEELARNDMILITRYADDNYYVELPETVEGTVASYDKNNDSVSVDGESYINSGGRNLTTNKVAQFVEEEMVDNSYILYLDPYGNVLGYEETDSIVGKYAVVRGIELSGSEKMGYTAKVRLILEDGTLGTFDLNMAATAVRLGLVASTATTKAKEDALATDTAYFAKDPVSKEQVGTALLDHLFSYTLDNNVVTLARPYHINDKRYISNYVLNSVLKNAGELSGVTNISKNVAQYKIVGLTDAGETITANDNTIFFIKDKASGSSDYYTVHGLSRLPATSATDASGKNTVAGIPISGNAEAIAYKAPNTTATVARAIFIETNNVFRSARNFTFVTDDYVYSGAGSTPVYTFTTVNTDGETSKMTTTSNPEDVKNTVREYYQDGSYITFEKYSSSNPYSVDSVFVKEWDGKTVTLYDIDSNSFVGSYRVDNGADIWDVQHEPARSNLSINDKVAVKLTGENVVEAAFIYDVMEGSFADLPDLVASQGANSAKPGQTLAATVPGTVTFTIGPVADGVTIKDFKVNGVATTLSAINATTKLCTATYTLPGDAQTGDTLNLTLSVNEDGRDELIGGQYAPIALNFDTVAGPASITLNTDNGSSIVANAGNLLTHAEKPVSITRANVGDTITVTASAGFTVTVGGDANSHALDADDFTAGKIVVVVSKAGWSRTYEVPVSKLTKAESGEPLGIKVVTGDTVVGTKKPAFDSAKDDLITDNVVVNNISADDTLKLNIEAPSADWVYTYKLNSNTITGGSSYTLRAADFTDGTGTISVAITGTNTKTGDSWTFSGNTLTVNLPTYTLTVPTGVTAQWGSTPTTIASGSNGEVPEGVTVTLGNSFTYYLKVGEGTTADNYKKDGDTFTMPSANLDLSTSAKYHKVTMANPSVVTSGVTTELAGNGVTAAIDPAAGIFLAEGVNTSTATVTFTLTPANPAADVTATIKIALSSGLTGVTSTTFATAENFITTGTAAIVSGKNTDTIKVTSSATSADLQISYTLSK